MISSVLLGILSVPGAAVIPLPTPTTSVRVTIQEENAQDEGGAGEDPAKLIEAAGDDLAKVLALAKEWKAAGQSADAKKAFTRALELDANNELAHKGLRHHFYDDQWFTSYSAMSKYRREEVKRKADEGFSRMGDEWVLTEDMPYIRMGWVKGDTGKWTDPVVTLEMEHEKELLAEGQQLRMEDGSWVPPDDFDKWTAGLWKCGDEWLPLEQANAYHADVKHWWTARTAHFDVLTTCDMDTLIAAKWNAEQTYADLSKFYGIKPAPGTRPDVLVFKNLEQFNAFAAGDQAAGTQAAEASGFSSLHYAYFADSYYDFQSQPPRFKGTGVAYWDSSDAKMAPYGLHSVRHAAGLAYVEAIAPSFNTIGAALAASSPPDLDAFWAEKPIPRWMFYGAAAYVERYYKDSQAENPWWAREWSVENLRKGGELDSLENIFSFGLSLDTIEASTRLISEAGLVVSFIMDGGCLPVIQKHAAFKGALRAGKGTKDALKDLQDSLLANQAALDEYVLGT